MPARITLSAVGEDGQVTCDCNPASGCCLYPFPYIDGEDTRYPTTDLPNTILVEGLPFTLIPIEYRYSGSLGGIPYSISADPADAFAWVLKNDDVFSIDASSICLLGTDWLGDVTTVEDQFSSSYIASGSNAGDDFDVPIERDENNICAWRGSSGPFQVSLVYDSTFVRWEMSVTKAASWGIVLLRDDPQSSPAGTYSGAGTATVS